MSSAAASTAGDCEVFPGDNPERPDTHVPGCAQSALLLNPLMITDAPGRRAARIASTIDMAKYRKETVTQVIHWNDSLFSFKTTRSPGARFRNGQFLMIGLEVEGKPLMRAYSVVSPNHEEELEFLSIKVPEGPLTSRLQNIQAGDEVLVSEKATGTLVIDDLKPGKHLYLLSTGTGLAPFMSIVRDPETYERFEKVVLIHGVRTVSELAYGDYLRHELPDHEYLGELVRDRLIYYPTVTREAFEALAAPIVAAARAHQGPLHGILLGLHGAMVLDFCDDGEGELLRRLRGAIQLVLGRLEGLLRSLQFFLRSDLQGVLRGGKGLLAFLQLGLLLAIEC